MNKDLAQNKRCTTATISIYIGDGETLVKLKEK